MKTEQIRNVKNCFDTPAIYTVYKHCMYLSTWEKFLERAKIFMADGSIEVFAYFDGDNVAGVIAVKREEDEELEILGIAVNPDFRGRGIGTKLIDFVLYTLSCKCLSAETDDDAVGFYEKYGFETRAFLKNGMYRRYCCTHRYESGSNGQ